MAEKVYVNKTNKQRAIHFTDGSTKFLRRGAKVSTSKTVKKMDEGIVEKQSKANTSTKQSDTKQLDTKQSETKQESE